MRLFIIIIVFLFTLPFANGDNLPVDSMLAIANQKYNSNPSGAIVFLEKEIINYSGREKEKLLKGMIQLCSDAFENEKAHRYSIQYLEIQFANKNELEQAWAHKTLGNVYLDMKQFDISLNHFNHALLIYEKFKKRNEYAQVLNNIGNLYITSKDYKTAIEFYKKSQNLFFSLGDSVKAYIVKNNIGAVYKNAGKLNEALSEYEAVLKNGIRHNDYKTISMGYHNISTILNSKNQFIAALEFEKKAIDIKQKNHYRFELQNSYLNIADIYSKLSDNQNASLFYNKYIDLHDTLLNEKTIKAINELNIKYETEKKEIENQFLKEKLFQNQRFQFVLGGATLLLLVAIFLVLRLLKMKRKAYEKDNLLFQQAQELSKQKETEYQIELENQKLEIVNYTKNLLKYNNLIYNFRTQLNELKPFLNNEGKKQLFSLFNEYNLRKNEYNWDDFNMMFQQVHRSYYNKLIAKHEDLTTNERKLCVFITMRLNTQEISAITLQSINSINVAKNRLKKKLNIEDEDEIGNYLKQFEENEISIQPELFENNKI